MIKEFIIKFYLVFFRMFFLVFNFMLQKQKTVFVTSFADNSIYVMDALKEKVPNEEIVILKDVKSSLNPKLFPDEKVLIFNDFKRPFQFIHSIYHLATSRIIFVDNYFGFIAGMPISKKQVIVQLWHAAGAVKKLGLENEQVKLRRRSARDRFQYVYDQFDYFVVGSERMGEIFISAFNTTEDNLLRTGIPRTDFFLNEVELQKVKRDIENTYPFIKNKKVILYAPTFRDNKQASDMYIDYERLKNSISSEYVLLIKYHPRLNKVFKADVLPDFVYDVSMHQDVNELLTVVDILVTDYSSLPFEFALLKRPMIFFVPDLDKYSKSRGLWEPLDQSLPGPITKNTDELIEAINHASVHIKEIDDFNLRWNTYSNGQSSQNLIDVFYP